MIIGKIIYSPGDGIAQIKMNEEFHALDSTIKMDLAADISEDAQLLHFEKRKAWRREMDKNKKEKKA